MNFSIKDFLRKCDQIHSLRSFLQIWSQLLKKSLMKNFIFCAVKKKINIWLWMTYIGIAKIVLLQLRKTKFIKRKCRKNTKRKHNS